MDRPQKYCLPALESASGHVSTPRYGLLKGHFGPSQKKPSYVYTVSRPTLSTSSRRPLPCRLSPLSPHAFNVHAGGRVIHTVRSTVRRTFGRQLKGVPWRSSSQPKPRSQHLLGYPRPRKNLTACRIEAGRPRTSSAVYCISFEANPASSPRNRDGVRGSCRSGQVRTSPLSPWRSGSVRYTKTAFTARSACYSKGTSRQRATLPARSKPTGMSSSPVKSAAVRSLSAAVLSSRAAMKKLSLYLAVGKPDREEGHPHRSSRLSATSSTYAAKR